MILVVGATGRLGGLVANRLLRGGWPVRILVRNHSPSEELAQQGLDTPAGALIAAGAQPVYGDLKDPASLVEACRGVETVITTANAAARGGADTVETVERQGNRALIDAARAAGVKHFVFVSAQFATPGSPFPFLAAKAAAEACLRDSGMAYTIIAPDAFMDVWFTQVVILPALQGLPVTVVGSGRRKHAFVAMRDVGAFILAALEHPAARNRRLVVGGPEAVSFRDAASAFGRILERDIPVRSVLPGQPLPGLPQAMWPLAASFDYFDSPVEMRGTARAFGVHLTPMEAFLRRQLAELMTAMQRP